MLAYGLAIVPLPDVSLPLGATKTPRASSMTQLACDGQLLVLQVNPSKPSEVSAGESKAASPVAAACPSASARAPSAAAPSPPPVLASASCPPPSVPTDPSSWALDPSSLPSPPPSDAQVPLSLHDPTLCWPQPYTTTP